MQRPLPLPVRSVGHYRLHNDHPEIERQRWFYEVFWGIDGMGSFFVDGEWVSLVPGELFIYKPSERHQIRQDSPYWEYRWFTCDGDNVGLWLNEMGMNGRKLPAGPCPSELFERLHAHILDNTPAGEAAASALAYQILLHALPSTTTTQLPASPVYRIRTEIDARFTDASLSIEALAREHGLHRSTLYRQFLATFGVAPLAYIRSRRIQKALSLLKETAMPMSEVASLSGFTDETYFSSVIRETISVSPGVFRRRG